MYVHVYNTIVVDVDSEEEDEEEAAQQLDTDKHIAERTGDVAYLKFMNRVRKGGASQVLRYVQPGSVTSSSSSGASSSSASADTATTPLSTESVVAIDPKPLCTTTDACAPDTSVPSCQRCGAKRIFEFQVRIILSCCYLAYIFDVRRDFGF